MARIEEEEFTLLFDRSLLLCGARPDNPQWDEQRREWFAWFGRYDADIVRRAFPLMLKALDPEQGERLPSFVRMRAVVDSLMAQRKSVDRRCDICKGEGVFTISKTGQSDWMRQEDARSMGLDGVAERRVRCVCDAGGRAHDSIVSVGRYLPLSRPAQNKIAPGAVTRMANECMRVAREAHDRGEKVPDEVLEKIADKYWKEATKT